MYGPATPPQCGAPLKNARAPGAAATSNSDTRHIDGIRPCLLRFTVGSSAPWRSHAAPSEPGRRDIPALPGKAAYAST